MSSHIGIVACSAEGAALCYRTVCIEGAELLGAYGHPEVSMHTHSLAEYVPHIARNDWAAVGELMLSSARKLSGAGAEFLICPDNTIHQAMPHVAPRSPLPWLHIAEVVADRAIERGFRRSVDHERRELAAADARFHSATGQGGVAPSDSTRNLAAPILQRRRREIGADDAPVGGERASPCRRQRPGGRTQHVGKASGRASGS